MSSYKPHAIAGLIFALPFIPSVFYLFFALLGASIPDMDHHNNNNKVYSMFAIGIVLSILLFFYDGLSISALILVSLAVIFYLSKHRGFTHSFLGIGILSFLFMLMVMGFIPVLSRIFLSFGFNISSSFILLVILALLGYFVISRRYLYIYLLVLAIYLIIFPVDYTSIQWSMVLLTMFIGALSHIVLDLWTPAGLKVFKPFTDFKFHKGLAIILVVVWLLSSIFVLWNYGSFITYLNPLFMYT
ncbi:metal-dependent hydrolase [Methanosphaera sp.]